MSIQRHSLSIVTALGVIVASQRAQAYTFAQLACESRCLTEFKACAASQNHAGGNYYLCEDTYYDCKFGCTGALDPFSSGISTPASVLSNGRRLVVSGHASCEAGAT